MPLTRLTLNPALAQLQGEAQLATAPVVRYTAVSSLQNGPPRALHRQTAKDLLHGISTDSLKGD